MEVGTKKELKGILFFCITIGLTVLFLLSAFVLLIEGFGSYYDYLNPLTIGEDDLGAPMFVLSCTIISMVISFPFIIYFSYRLSKKITDKLIKE